MKKILFIIITIMVTYFLVSAVVQRYDENKSYNAGHREKALDVKPAYLWKKIKKNLNSFFLPGFLIYL